MRTSLFLALVFLGCAPSAPPQNEARADCTPRDCAEPRCAEACRRASPPDDPPEGMCTIAPKGDGCDAKDAGAADAVKTPVTSAETPLPPARPATIALRRGTSDKVDQELGLADDSFEKNDLVEATRHYQAAQAASPKHPGPIVGLARARIAKTGAPLDYGAGKGNKEIEGAVKDLKRAAAMDDAYGPAHVELGRALLMLGDAEAALSALVKGAQLLPKEPEAHSALGIARLATGKADEAVSPLAKAAELDPGSAARRGNYGTVLLMRGKVKEAIEQYRAATRIAPADARARSDLGTALLADNDVTGALAELEKAIALDPSRASAHSNYGYALQIKGDLPKAIAEYRAALKIDDKLASAWINLATALAREPQTRKEARAALEKARAIDPTDPRVKANLEELDQLEKGH